MDSRARISAPTHMAQVYDDDDDATDMLPLLGPVSAGGGSLWLDSGQQTHEHDSGTPI